MRTPRLYPPSALRCTPLEHARRTWRSPLHARRNSPRAQVRKISSETTMTLRAVTSGAHRAMSTLVLARGARGPSVVDLQRRLAAKGFNPGAIDGSFGLRTEAAIRAFQSSRHLAVDGIAGPQTLGALAGHSSAPAASSNLTL